jgi:hypothetical protein
MGEESRVGNRGKGQVWEKREGSWVGKGQCGKWGVKGGERGRVRGERERVSEREISERERARASERARERER